MAQTPGEIRHTDGIRTTDGGVQADERPATDEIRQMDSARAADGERQWRKLPDAVKRVWMINDTLGSLIILAVAAVFAAVCLTNDGWWNGWTIAVTVLVAIPGVLNLITCPLQANYAYAFNTFSIGERDIKLRKGWLFRSSVTVPCNRVQHVDTKQGPVLRAFGLTAVVVSTAIGEHTIDALESAEAERVVEQITARVLAAKEDL